MRKQHSSCVIGFVTLFVVSFAAVNWVYGYVITFRGETNDAFFMFGRSFFLKFFDHPGGIVRYAGRFLGQFYQHKWLGAMIVSGCITCFGALFFFVLAKLEDRVHIAQTLLPCALLLVLHTSTNYALHDTLGLCTCCGVFLGYLSFRGTVARRVFAVVATPILYFLFGVYVWFFVAWVLAFEWCNSPLRTGALFDTVYAVFSFAAPLVAWRWVFPIPLSSALTCPVMFGPPFRTGWPSQTSGYFFVVDCCLALALAISLVLIPFWSRLFSGTRLMAFWRAEPDKRSRVALAIALSVLAILIHLVRYDKRFATVVACRQLYKQKEWDALLEEAKKDSSGDILLQFMANSALYHKGSLLDEMFKYPQVWGTRGLVLNISGQPGLSPAEDDSCRAMYNSDLFYEMGHINAAFKHAYNSLCVWEETYDILKRMAECSMVNGNYDLATKYLNMLEKTLFHRDFARHYKAIIADPDAAEREFGDLRKRFPLVDGKLLGPAPFQTLLDTRPDNRMALDYLMAWLLLDKTGGSIAKIAANVDRFKKAGYASIPTHCQEAMLLWERSERASVDLQGNRYDEATTALVDEFFQYLSANLRRQDAPEQAQALYGDTFVFYFILVAKPTASQVPFGAGGDFGGALREE